MSSINSQIILMLIFVGVFASTFLIFNPTANVVLEFKGYAEAIQIEYNNFEQEMPKNEIITSLPENALLVLRFYNFNTGEREWEKAFIIKKAYVKELKEPMKSDVEVWLSSNYLNELTDKNFCEVIKKANINGDLRFETNLNKINLIWKYKSLLKYKSCI